jgi:hypothetical protein
MIVYEIGISYLDKQYQVVKLLFLQNTCKEMCVPMPQIMEKHDNYNKIQCMRELQHDLAITHVNPLEVKGINTKWSIE